MNTNLAAAIRSIICSCMLMVFSTSAYSLQITGTVSLPGGNTVLGSPLGVFVDVFVRDSNGNVDFDASNSAFVEILVGSNQSSYTVDFDQAPAGGDYEILTFCSTNCGPYIGQNYLPGGVFDFRKFDNPPVTQADLPTEIDFVLVEGVEVSTTISLPNSEVADGDMGHFVDFRVDESGFGAALFFARSFVTIPDQSSSVTFLTTVPNVPAGGTFQISTNCDENCGVYASSTQYLQDDGSSAFGVATSIDPDVFPIPSNLTFTLVEGQAISGQVSLPGGFTQTDTIEVRLDLTELSASGDFISQTSQNIEIVAGGAAPSYLLSFVPNTDSVYQFSYGCVEIGNDCQSLLGPGQTFFTPAGIVTRTEFGAADLSSAELSGVIDLTLLEGETLSGAIQLADNATAAADMTFIVDIITSGVSSFSLGFDFVTLPQGQNSIDYDLTYVPLENDELVLVQASCFSNCGVFSRQNLFLQVDGSVGSAFARVSDVPDVLNFEFFEANLLTGSVTLPLGFIATQSTEVSIFIEAYSDLAGTQRVESVFDTITIPLGSSSAAFSIPIANVPEGSYSIIYGCLINAACGEITSGVRYTPSGISTNPFNSVFPASDLPENIELPLQLGRRFTGEVRLPVAAELLAIDLNLSVTISAFDENGVFRFGQADFLEIAAGQRSATFAVVLPALNDGDQIEITYGCGFRSDCGVYIGGINYTPEGPVFDLASARFPAVDLPSGELILELVEGVQFSGVVALPDGFIANDDFRVQVNVGVQNPQGDLGTLTRRELTILQNESSVAFSFPVVPLTEGSYTVSYGCGFGQDCGTFVDRAFFTPDAIVFSAEQARIPFEDLPDNVVLQLVEGSAISGALVLPEGVTAVDGLETASFGVTITSISESGDVVFDGFSGVSIPDGGVSSTEFKIVVPEIEGAVSRVEYACFNFTFSDCGDLVLNYYHTSEGPVFAEGDAELFSTLPTPLELPLIVGRETNFELRRPISEPDFPLQVILDISVAAFSDDGLQVGEQKLRRSILFNQAARQFSFTLLEIPDGAGRYDFEFSCSDEFADASTSDCLAFEADAASYSFSIQNDSLPDVVVMQLLERPVPILPDSFEVDNTPELANSIAGRRTQSRTIHEAGDIDFLTFLLEEPADINIRTENNGDEGKPALALLDSRLVEIENSNDVLSSEELESNSLSTIERLELPAGEYFIRVEGFSPTGLIRSYRLQFDDGSDDSLCFPVRLASGQVSLICL